MIGVTYLIGPQTIFPLVTVKRTERDNVVCSEPLRPTRQRPAHGNFFGRTGSDSAAVLVDKIHHVGIAVVAELQQIRGLKSACDPLDEGSPTTVIRVVQVNQQYAPDVHQKNRVLVVVGERHDASSLGKLDPFPLREDLHVQAHGSEIPVDPVPDVIREQNRFIGQIAERFAVQMVRMPVRKPNVGASIDGIELFGGNGVAKTPSFRNKRRRAPRDLWL